MLEFFREWTERIFNRLFDKKFKTRVEEVILLFALIGFVVHLALIFLHRWEIIHLNPATGDLLKHPISAIYTPFSFILVYEVYLLVYHLPESFTISIGKQYEIISLIVIRRIFKDISKVELTEDWFSNKYDVLLTVDMTGFLILFFLIYLFNRLSNNRPQLPPPERIDFFILTKKLISIILIPLLIGLSIYSLSNWISEIQQFNLGQIKELSDINNIFYNEFFTVLVLVDVFILIVSLRFTENYSQLIRNTGFIISTILIRLSFSAEGYMNMVLILAGVLFGVLILGIYNLIGKMAEEGNKL